jgi:hypothetical protein
VARADRGDRLDVAGRRRAHAARADHGLAEERSHVPRSHALDLRLQRLRRLVVDVRDRAEQRAVALTHGFDADEARAEPVCAVIGVRAADQVDALWLSPGCPVLARELGSRVDRIAAAEAEEHARVAHRRELDESIHELERRGVCDVPERLERLECPQLLPDRLRHVLAAVPDVGVPEACGAVQVAPSLVVPEVDTLASRDHELVAGDGGHVGERVPVGAGRCRRADGIGDRHGV